MPKAAFSDPETLADLCLSHLAADPELLAQFMGTTGYSPAGLRAAVGSSQLSHGLIDFFAQNEPLLVAFCASHAMTPEAFMRVWARLNPAG